MDYTKKTKVEIENDQKGMLLSISLHVLLLVLIYLMPTGGIVRPPEQTSIVVELPPDLLGGGPALGLPNQGQGDTPAPGEPDPKAGGDGAAAKPDPQPVQAPPPPVKPVISKSKPEPSTPPKKIETTEDPNAVALRRQQDEARRKVEEEKYKQAAAERERQRQEQVKRDAEDAAKRQAEADARAAQAARDKFKGRIGTGTGNQSGNSGGGGTGGGLGNSGKTGSGGQPDGDPDSRRLEGIGRGPGVVNGFGGRGVKSAPRLQENSQKAGKVVLDVCVDDNGSVISAKFKAVGSTTNDPDLIDAAVRNARQYKFAASSVDKQCGTITYNFIVR